MPLQSLGQEDPLEKETATHSSILAWRIPWTEEPGRLQSMGSQRVGHDWATKTNINVKSSLYNLSLFTLCKGFMTADERKLFDHLKSPHLKYWVPFIWFGNLAAKARKEGRIRDSVDLQSLMTVSILQTSVKRYDSDTNRDLDVKGWTWTSLLCSILVPKEPERLG